MALVLEGEEGRALASFMMKGERILAPSVLFAELIHVMHAYVTRGDFDASEAREKMEGIVALANEFVDDRMLHVEAFNESLRLGHSSCAMPYFVLARRMASTL